MSFAHCKEAIQFYVTQGETSSISTNKEDVKCEKTSSICKMSGYTDDYFACLSDPLTEPTTVFNYMHGKISPIKIKKSKKTR